MPHTPRKVKGAPQDVDTEAHAMVTVAAFRVEAGDKAPLAAHATQTRARVTKDIESERLLAEDDESLPSPSRGSKDGDEDYSKMGAWDIIKSRGGWLVLFCVGLLVSAVVVQRFSDLLEHHVQLSFFVPLIMGHGGNTGSQSVSTVLRALALKQVGIKDSRRVMWKEALAGGCMGGLIGLIILGFSAVWPHLSFQVGLAVAISLPIISISANLLGAILTIVADWANFDPAVTSVPLMTTLVDATGLIIYFYVAELVMDVDLDGKHSMWEAAHKTAMGMMTGSPPMHASPPPPRLHSPHPPHPPPKGHRGLLEGPW